MEGEKRTIKLGKRSLPVKLPGFADREDLVVAWSAAEAAGDGMALRRVAAAAVGLATRTGRDARASWSAHQCSVASYGGEVYGYLREHGAELSDIVRAGGEIVGWCAEGLFPRQDEVDARADFSGAGAPPTA
jgi:hypothetical protein